MEPNLQKSSSKNISLDSFGSTKCKLYFVCQKNGDQWSLSCLIFQLLFPFTTWANKTKSSRLSEGPETVHFHRITSRANDQVNHASRLEVLYEPICRNRSWLETYQSSSPLRKRLLIYIYIYTYNHIIYI